MLPLPLLPNRTSFISFASRRFQLAPFPGLQIFRRPLQAVITPLSFPTRSQTHPMRPPNFVRSFLSTSQQTQAWLPVVLTSFSCRLTRQAHPLLQTSLRKQLMQYLLVSVLIDHHPQTAPSSAKVSSLHLPWSAFLS